MHTHLQVDGLPSSYTKGRCPFCRVEVTLAQYNYRELALGALPVSGGEVYECDRCGSRLARVGWILRIFMSFLFLLLILLCGVVAWYALRGLWELLKAPADAPAVLWMILPGGLGLSGFGLYRSVRALKRMWSGRFVPAAHGVSPDF